MTHSTPLRARRRFLSGMAAGAATFAAAAAHAAPNRDGHAAGYDAPTMMP